MVGGDGGIGRACVTQFLAQGDDVVVIDRARGHDAADPASVAAALTGVDSITNVVHAAGSVGSGGIEETSVEDWSRVIYDNLTSAFVVCRQVLPLMGRGGSVVLLSSVNGRHGGNRLSGPAYATAKAGLIGLTRHLAKDQASRGIRVNAIAPGPVSSPMLDRLTHDELAALLTQVPLGHVASPDEVAGTAAWLCSSAGSSVTGAIIDLNGGMWMG